MTEKETTPPHANQIGWTFPQRASDMTTASVWASYTREVLLRLFVMRMRVWTSGTRTHTFSVLSNCIGRHRRILRKAYSLEQKADQLFVASAKRTHARCHRRWRMNTRTAERWFDIIKDNVTKTFTNRRPLLWALTRIRRIRQNDRKRIMNGCS